MTNAGRLPAERVVVDPAARREAVLAVIRGARSKLVLSLFRCNDRAIFDALTEASGRGVAVEVLMTSRARGGKAKQRKLWDALEATGAVVRAHSDPVVKYHAKYMVADDGPAVVASLNFTRKCFRKTVDALVITYDPAVVTGLQDLMHADREDRAIPDHLSMRLIVGPERARRQLTEIIEQAQSSIRLIDAKVSDPALCALLRARRTAGLNVELFEAKRINGLRSHGKLMLVDDTLAVIGGLSLNALSLDFRREVALVVDDLAVIADLRRLFESIGPPDAVNVPAQVDHPC